MEVMAYQPTGSSFWKLDAPAKRSWYGVKQMSQEPACDTVMLLFINILRKMPRLDALALPIHSLACLFDFAWQNVFHFRDPSFSMDSFLQSPFLPRRLQILSNSPTTTNYRVLFFARRLSCKPQSETSELSQYLFTESVTHIELPYFPDASEILSVFPCVTHIAWSWSAGCGHGMSLADLKVQKWLSPIMKPLPENKEMVAFRVYVRNLEDEEEEEAERRRWEELVETYVELTRQESWQREKWVIVIDQAMEPHFDLPADRPDLWERALMIQRRNGFAE